MLVSPKFFTSGPLPLLHSQASLKQALTLNPDEREQRVMTHHLKQDPTLDLLGNFRLKSATLATTTVA